MSYNRQAKKAKALLEELNNIRDLLDGIEHQVLSIEDEIVGMDNSLPADEEIAAMPDGQDKKRLRELLSTIEEAYKVIDDILGPPAEETSVDEFLRQFPVRGNGRVN